MVLTASATTAAQSTITPVGNSWGAVFDSIQTINDDQLQSDLAIDLCDVTAIDSSDLGAMVGLRLKLEARDCHLLLINVNPHVKEVLEISRLIGMFHVHEKASIPNEASHGFGNWLRHLMA